MNNAEPGGLDLVVEDNGHGFDPSTIGVLGHQGLLNMRSRMAAIGATVDVTSDATAHEGPSSIGRPQARLSTQGSGDA